VRGCALIVAGGVFIVMLLVLPDVLFPLLMLLAGGLVVAGFMIGPNA